MDATELEHRVRALEDVEAIKRLKHRYADACDRGYDADALVEFFAEDAVWDGGLFGRYEGREAIRAFFRGVSADIVFAMHYMMNPVIAVDGDRATGTWYLFQTCTFAKGNPPIGGAALYDEAFVRQADGWKFQHLRLVSSYWTPYEEGWVKRPFVQEA
jgi:ketosteroid isomerase-like protein